MNASDCRHFIRTFLAQEGLPPESILFIARPSEAFHPSFWNQIDLYLDSWPHSYPLGVAASLQRGIPAVTQLGTTMVGRSGASILHHWGFAEWIAQDGESYLQIASTLAQAGDRRKTSSNSPALSPHQSGVHDLKRFAQDFQQLLHRLC